MEDTTEDKVSEIEDSPDNDSNQHTTNVKQSSNEEEDPVSVTLCSNNGNINHPPLNGKVGSQLKSY